MLDRASAMNTVRLVKGWLEQQQLANFCRDEALQSMVNTIARLIDDLAPPEAPPMRPDAPGPQMQPDDVPGAPNGENFP